MAISDVKEYTHLSAEQVEELGRELDAIRAEVETSRGSADAAYIRRLIRAQRTLALAGRVALFASHKKPALAAGVACLASAKILENMEIGHNVMHGQWDWLNDPEIHSSNWEWDTAQPAEQWKHSHNYIHHQFTNVLGYDNDIGYGIMRMAREQRWHPFYLGQPVYNALLAGLFQWGVSLHDLDLDGIRKGKRDPQEVKAQVKQILVKGRNQILKDYVVYPALSGPNWKSTIKANATANLIRNVWSYTVIFMGHFPDGALHFTEEEVEDETRAEWYLRQMLGSANFKGGKAVTIAAGSLNYQIEHHLFPDLPSNRYPEIAVKVRALCHKYQIPYTTGPIHQQYGQTLRTIVKLSVPNSWTSDDAPEPIAPPVERGRKQHNERPTRRTETGGWSRKVSA